MLTEGQVTEGIEVTGYNKETLGEQEITVRYTQDEITQETSFKVDVTKDKIEYQENENGVTITKIEVTDGSNKAEIPSRLLQKYVIGIGKNVVTNLNDTEIVYIPNTVTQIADNAFKNEDETTNEELTIECNYGSTAESYAKEKEMYYEFTDKNISEISVNTENMKTEYSVRRVDGAIVIEELDLNGGKIVLTYEGSTEEAPITSIISLKKTGVSIEEQGRVLNEKEFSTTYKEKTSNFKATFGIMGDLDLNGRITMNDVTKGRNHYAALRIGEEDGLIEDEIIFLADMDGNGRVTMNDVTMLRNKYADVRIGN